MDISKLGLSRMMKSSKFWAGVVAIVAAWYAGAAQEELVFLIKLALSGYVGGNVIEDFAEKLGRKK